MFRCGAVRFASLDLGSPPTVSSGVFPPEAQVRQLSCVESAPVVNKLRPWSGIALGMAFATVAVPAVQVLSSPPASAREPGSLSAQASSTWQSNATVWKMAYGAGDIWMAGAGW